MRWRSALIGEGINHYVDTNTNYEWLDVGAGGDLFLRCAAPLLLFLLLPQVHCRKVRHDAGHSGLDSDSSDHSLAPGWRSADLVFNPALHSDREYHRGRLYVGKSLPGTRKKWLAGNPDVYSSARFILYSVSRVFGIGMDGLRW
jgi:hypothetical protein